MWKLIQRTYDGHRLCHQHRWHHLSARWTIACHHWHKCCSHRLIIKILTTITSISPKIFSIFIIINRNRKENNSSSSSISCIHTRYDSAKWPTETDRTNIDNKHFYPFLLIYWRFFFSLSQKSIFIIMSVYVVCVKLFLVSHSILKFEQKEKNEYCSVVLTTKYMSFVLVFIIFKCNHSSWRQVFFFVIFLRLYIFFCQCVLCS